MASSVPTPFSPLAESLGVVQDQAPIAEARRLVIDADTRYRKDHELGVCHHCSEFYFYRPPAESSHFCFACLTAGYDPGRIDLEDTVEAYEKEIPRLGERIETLAAALREIAAGPDAISIAKRALQAAGLDD